MKKFKKELKHSLLSYLVTTLGISYIYLVGKTSRTRLLGKDAHDAVKQEHPRMIYVGWHEQVLTSSWILRHQNIAVMISHSRDGEYLARLNRMLGFYSVRGSSSRGGVRGLLQLVNVMKEGHDVLLGADGPKGPARECKAGAILLAKHSGAPIIPMAGHITRSRRVKSWDRTIIAFPFSTYIIKYGDPIFVPKEIEKSAIADYQQQVKQTIDRLSEEVKQEA